MSSFLPRQDDLRSKHVTKTTKGKLNDTYEKVNVTYTYKNIKLTS